MVLENEIGTIERQLAALLGPFAFLPENRCILALSVIKEALGSLSDLCVSHCNCCNMFYNNSEMNFCEECCVGCQGKEHDNINYYCSECRAEIGGARAEMDAVIRGDYI
tara:strand:+ start:1310 stop:1636 length:327 start_codon:yes stop_codon:yes gene_type:complete